MQEVFKLLIGIAVLILGIPIGNVLAKNTQEELRDGRKWFILLILVCLAGGILGLIFNNDVLLFAFFFIAIVSSMSLNHRKKNGKKKH